MSDNAPSIPEHEQPKSVKRRRTRNYFIHLDADFPAKLPKTEALPYLRMTQLVRAAQAGDIPAFQTLWLHFARITYSVVNRFSFPSRLLEDCVQEGVIGLGRAIEKFDVDRLNDFSTYAWNWIYQGIQRYLASNLFDGHTPTHQYGNYTGFRQSRRSANTANQRHDLLVRQLTSDPGLYHAMFRIHRLVHARRFGTRAPGIRSSADDPAEQIERAELLQIIRNNLARLAPRERDILKRRYGIDDHEPQSLEEIGQDYGLTRERIRQIEAKAEGQLRSFMLSYVSLDPGWDRPTPADRGPLGILQDPPVETEPTSSLNMPPDDDQSPETRGPPLVFEPFLFDMTAGPAVPDFPAFLTDLPCPTPSPSSAICSANCSSSTTPTSTSASTAS